MQKVLIVTSAVTTCLLDDEGQLLQIVPDPEKDLGTAISNIEGEIELISDASYIEDLLAGQDIPVNIQMDHPILKEWRQSRYNKIINTTGMVTSHEDYLSKVQQYAMEETFEKIKDKATQKDELVAQVVHAIDDLQKTINLLANRLHELYGLHYPELVQTINNPITLARIISSEPQRKRMTRQVLETAGIPENKIQYLVSSKDHSLGGDLDDHDLLSMQEYARNLIYTAERKNALERWIDDQMNEIAPNLTAVAGANVGARLISAMGSLIDLAKTHSSKVQIIGAEAALYSALRGSGKPPKHGIIYQIPEIGNAPYWYRGKLARAFASKIVIAARLDQFDGDFLGEKLREELREMEKELREQSPQPPSEEE